MFRFSLTKRPQVSREPFSLQTLAKASRLRGATVTESVCPYCAVGCGQLIFSKGGELIDIEGDPESPSVAVTFVPKAQTPFSSPSIRTASAMSCIALPTPIIGRRKRWTGRWIRLRSG